MTGHKKKVNNFLVLDLFPFHSVQDYLLVEGFSRTPSSLDVLKIVGVVYRHTPGLCFFWISKYRLKMVKKELSIEEPT